MIWPVGKVGLMPRLYQAELAVKVQTIETKFQPDESIENSGKARMHMDNRARQDLMQKLARRDDTSSPASQRTAYPAVSFGSFQRSKLTIRADGNVQPTPYVVVANMFNPEE